MKHVLVIDNDSSIRKALKIGLPRADWIVETVPATGTRAVEIINHSQYHIIIADLDMEETALLDVIRGLKVKNQGLIIIGMTRNNTMELFSEKNTGFINACYQKPLHLNMLISGIFLELKKQ